MGNDLAKQEDRAVKCEHQHVNSVISPCRYGWEGTCEDCGKKVFASTVEYKMSGRKVFMEEKENSNAQN